MADKTEYRVAIVSIQHAFPLSTQYWSELATIISFCNYASAKQTLQRAARVRITH